MDWPDEIENRKVWDGLSGKTTTVAVNRYEITPGMMHHDVFRALIARTEFLIEKVEKLESERQVQFGIRISQGDS